MLLFLLLLMLLLLFLPRSLLLLLLLFLLLLLIAGRGFTRGVPLVAEKPTPFRNCGTGTGTLITQDKFSSCSNDAASAPQGAAFSPSAICCATTR